MMSLLGLAAARAPVFAQTPAPLFEWVGMYSPGSGNTDADVRVSAGYNPVPYLWHFDPMINGIPSPRARLTYVAQQAGATASPASAWRGFFAHQDAAVEVGGNPLDANDIADTIAWFKSQNYPIDYVLADLEGTTLDGDWSNTYNLINQVRGSSVGARTAIGNYNWFPGSINLGADYPHSADLRATNTYYASTAANGMAGLTVAMPAGYPLQAFAIHADDTWSWGPAWWTLSNLPESAVSYLTYNQQAAIGAAYLSPNERAGMFYGPLEEVSVAERNLPAGQQLIPWVSAYQATNGQPDLQPGQAPTAQDNEAFIEHLRLRGADGFAVFGGDGTPAYAGTYADGTTFSAASRDAYAADMASTWHGMDWFFALPTQVGAITANGPLNLFTFKNTGGTWTDPAGRNGGIEWSGYQRGNRILALISNLGNGPQAANGLGTGNNGNWQSVFSARGSALPTQSPVVPAGNHLVVQYLTNPTLVSFNGYGPGTALGAAQGWHDSSGGNFVVQPAAGTGDGGNQVVTIANAASTAWVADSTTANPGGIGDSANDTMTYFFRVYTGWSGGGSAAFAPVVGSGSGVPVPAQQNGPTLWVFAGGTSNYWAFGSNLASGATYYATNLIPTLHTWYAVQMIVNPAADSATIYVENLTSGNGGWTLLQFNTQTMSGQNLTSVPAGLISGEDSPSLYNGFEISGSPGAQFDAMEAQLYPYPASPQSSYVPTIPSGGGSPPPPGGSDGATDGPLPVWTLFCLAAGILAAASRRLSPSTLKSSARF